MYIVFGDYGGYDEFVQSAYISKDAAISDCDKLTEYLLAYGVEEIVEGDRCSWVKIYDTRARVAKELSQSLENER